MLGVINMFILFKEQLCSFHGNHMIYSSNVFVRCLVFIQVACGRLYNVGATADSPQDADSSGSSGCDLYSRIESGQLYKT